MTWQPIATAPRDGTHILARVEYRDWSAVDVRIVRYDAFIENFMFDSIAFQQVERPGILGRVMITHWQPLPSTDLGNVEGAA